MGSHGEVKSSQKVVTVVKSISGGAGVPECSIRGGGVRERERERERNIYICRCNVYWFSGTRFFSVLMYFECLSSIACCPG